MLNRFVATGVFRITVGAVGLLALLIIGYKLRVRSLELRWRQYDEMASQALQKGDERDAVKFYREALQATSGLSSRDQLRALALENLSDIEMRRGQYGSAEKNLTTALQIRDADSKYTDASVNDRIRLSQVYLHTSRISQAKVLLANVKATLDTHKALGYDQWLPYMDTLSYLEREEGRYDSALLLLQRCLKLKVMRFGYKSPQTIRTLRSIGLVYQKQGRYSDALFTVSRCIRTADNVSDIDPMLLVQLHNDLAVMYTKLGDCNKADRHFKEAMMMLDTHFGSSYPRSAWVYMGYGRMLRKCHRGHEATEYENRAKRIAAENRLPPLANDNGAIPEP